MEEIDNFWEEIKFEVGSLGKNYGEAVERKVLIGSGNREADILFIGDDPELYQNEDLKVAPSSSGEFLIKLCDIEGFTPEDYYITTLSKKDCKFLEFMEEDRKILKELLHMQIALINPKIIVALGTEVAETLLERDVKLGEERGKFLNWIGGIKLFITYDVNFVKKSRNEGGKKSKAALEFWNDLKNLKQELGKVNG
ncbi:uracil-DNA glycosylase family protein [uncultured Fusobacterium sp.]|uniref:uracil-DNA glycosylase family protein n=1 Tax=uncultured Fusobacterium sp. TaxID=159267 RepID=UPI0025FD0DDB|nr:uracil-DNA glycosylase family protein [uncultured Fusobacterium sp.]